MQVFQGLVGILLTPAQIIDWDPPSHKAIHNVHVSIMLRPS